MSLTWRELCRELINSRGADYYRTLERARKALADGPAVPECREPASVTQQSTNMPDWRGLCEELVNELHGYASANPHHDSDALVARARAALAQPEPEVGPTDEELLATLDRATADFPPRHLDAMSMNAVKYALALELRKARAVLARWGRPAPAPAEGEVK